MRLDDFISEALAEDIGDGDHTSLATIPDGAENKAKLLVKEEGIIAGIDIGIKVFEKVDSTLKVETFKKDGDLVKVGDIVLTVEGNARSILTAERLVLNIMQRMSGVSTISNKIQRKLEGLKTKVLDTRKTTPLLRSLEKLAVKIGGAYNHRIGLYDMILIKDNHIDYAGGIKNAIENTRNYLQEKEKDLKIEIEVRDLNELNQVLEVGGVNRIMLDNFSYDNLRKAVELIGGRYETESSGGITIENVRDHAECGVDYVSLGALTHSVKSLDLSLKAV